MHHSLPKLPSHLMFPTHRYCLLRRSLLKLQSSPKLQMHPSCRTRRRPSRPSIPTHLTSQTSRWLPMLRSCLNHRWHRWHHWHRSLPKRHSLQGHPLHQMPQTLRWFLIRTLR